MWINQQFNQRTAQQSRFTAISQKCQASRRKPIEHHLYELKNHVQNSSKAKYTSKYVLNTVVENQGRGNEQ
jgi:hypothetical protein